jgi:hypothetical protein
VIVWLNTVQLGAQAVNELIENLICPAPHRTGAEGRQSAEHFEAHAEHEPSTIVRRLKLRVKRAANASLPPAVVANELRDQLVGLVDRLQFKLYRHL